MKVFAFVRSAFSLVELLAVLAILAILSALTLPAISSSLAASRLTGAGQMVVDEIAFARQTALSRNLPVEVRLFLLPQTDGPARPAAFRGIQSFMMDKNRAIPIGRLKIFPSPIILSTSTEMSPFLSSTNHPEKTPAAEDALPNFGTAYRFRSFQFTPRGEAGVLNSENFFTLENENVASSGRPASFFTVQVNPITGGVRVFRP